VLLLCLQATFGMSVRQVLLHFGGDDPEAISSIKVSLKQMVCSDVVAAYGVFGSDLLQTDSKSGVRFLGTSSFTSQ